MTTENISTPPTDDECENCHGVFPRADLVDINDESNRHPSEEHTAPVLWCRGCTGDEPAPAACACDHDDDARAEHLAEAYCDVCGKADRAYVTGAVVAQLEDAPDAAAARAVLLDALSQYPDPDASC